MVEAKNWAADGRIVKALEAQQNRAAWKVVNQAEEQVRAASGVPIVWRVASKEAKNAIGPIFAGWKFGSRITGVVW